MLAEWVEPFLNEVVFQDVQASHHLTEHQHSVSAGLQFGQQLVDEHQLASCLDHGLERHVRYVWPMRVTELLCDLLLGPWTNENNSVSLGAEQVTLGAANDC